MVSCGEEREVDHEVAGEDVVGAGREAEVCGHRVGLVRNHG